jgi:molybdate transport system ATP-binding protein
METLRLDIDHGLRTFRLALALEIGAETVALVGPSGAGKSSVLRAVAGLLRPEQGVITFGAESWLDTTRRIDVPPERRKVGLLFQEYALFPHLDVRGNVAFGARDPRAVPELLERLRIGGLADARPSERAAKSSVSRLRVRWRARPTSSSSTSRCRRLTRTLGAPCGRSCTSS